MRLVCSTSLSAVFATAVFLFSGTLPAQAQNPEFFPPPSGWTASATAQGWLVQSATYTEGVISFIIPAVTSNSGDFVQSFAAEVPDMVGNAFGQVTESSAVETITKMLGPDPVLKSTHTITTDEGATARVEVIGYPVSEGVQIMFVVSPTSVPVNAEPMVTIHDFALNIRTQNFALTDDRLARALAYQNETRGGDDPVAVPDTNTGNEPDTATNTAPAPTLPDPVATPGAIGEAAVEAVVIGSVVQMGGPVISVRVPFLLLKDGRSIQELEQSPLDYNPAVRKPDTFEPAAWVTAPNGGYKVNYPDGSFYELDASGRLGPAPANYALTGTYIARGGRYGANWAEKLTFANGRVASNQAAIVSGANYDGGGTSSIAGDATISGWTITMPAANGQPTRYLFAKDNDEQPRVICIGYTLYLRE